MTPWSSGSTSNPDSGGFVVQLRCEGRPLRVSASESARNVLNVTL